MTFRHISELAGDVMRRVEIETGMGCAIEAHSHRPATEIVATAHLSGGEENSRLRASGEGTAAQTEWKGTPTEAGAKSSDASREVREHRAYAVGTAKQRTEADWRLIAASLNDMLRCMNRASATGAPPVARFIHLDIVRAHASTDFRRGAL